MRNGDFMPTRLQAQQEAVGRVCNAKTRSNPENNVGLLTMSANPQVLTTLTSDVHRIQAKLQQVQPKGNIDFLTAIRIAHLTLKHRQGKNHKMRIVAFVGSPIETDEKELIKVAKRLKKEKVNVDVVNFGEDQLNTEKLTNFVNAINGKDGVGGSHLVTIPPSDLTQALFNSPVIQGEDGAGAAMMGAHDFDPNDDPDLALALRVSMEEQRARQQGPDAAGQAGAAGSAGAESSGSGTSGAPGENVEDAMLAAALRMSEFPSAGPDDIPNIGSMTEDEQIAWALRMSMQQDEPERPQGPESPMDTDEADKDKTDGSKKENQK